MPCTCFSPLIQALPLTLTHYGEKVGTNCLDSAQSLPRYNDAIFLLYLLQRANPSLFHDVLDFSTVDFHHELLQHLSNISWPHERLQALVKPPTEAPSIKLIDCDLILAPCSIKRLETLAEIDLSDNRDLFDVRNLCGLKHLKRLTIRSCDIRSIAPLTNIKTLVKLDVTDNKLASIPEEIVNLKQLTNLLIRENRLRTLPSQILKSLSLEYLEVEEHLLHSVDMYKSFFEAHPTVDDAFVRIKSIDVEDDDLESKAVVDQKDFDQVQYDVDPVDVDNENEE